MSKAVAHDSLSAWERLREAGGLELDGRDMDFQERLKIALMPSALTLEEALRAKSTDDLVRAFFGLIQPFAEMFRAILDFFKVAGAREGRDQWEIHIEDEHLDLTHFQKFVEVWNSLEWDLDVPDVDFRGAWAVNDATRDLADVVAPLRFLDKDWRGTTGLADVDLWLKAYARGEYLPYPTSLQPARIAPPLADAAAIAIASLDIVRRTWPDRNAMLEEHRARHFTSDRADGFSPRTIAQNETDYWLGSTTAQLAAYATLDEPNRQVFAERLAQTLSSYPRRKIGVRAKQPELERILSLPLWQRRHELYAVWIATEIVNALSGHDCELHHEDGRIVFAFRETVVATVHSSRPEVRLIAERRQPLGNPLGRGRTANVQPDYGLWRGSGERETCGLVVEVKHYKRNAPAQFREVMVDYARAHPQAKVVLVSHGAAGEHFYDIDADVRDRCRAIGELTTNHREQRAVFREIVRDYVKEPVPRAGEDNAAAATAIAVDISGSMDEALAAPSLLGLVEQLAGGCIETLALIDTEIRKICKVAEAADAIRSTPRGSQTNLRKPLLRLLEDHACVIVVTDADGLAELGDEAYFDRLSVRPNGPASFEVVKVHRGALDR
ncbi:MAG: hypothetical protein HXX10_13325 [Rhodoplanes sp.]|uniref:hypothetical protein n=1 Tax=Rhodoplanes sp. TaxID=1968906 RepID=UPI0017AE9651|nr:hypothetical protein [Rhodoplanes sp.]NVO15011.1 hypothetical protein [Rhodoplanes sp.]